MSIPSTQDPTKALIQSIRMFLEEIESRNDLDEIRAAESAMWIVTLDADTRRNKTPPVKLPRITRVEQ